MSQTGSVGILIADDHALVRRGISIILETEPGMHVVGQASDGLEAVQLSCELKPDVILMDLKMPRMDGVSAIRELSQRVPDIPVIVLTSFAEDDNILPAIKAGAVGYLLKDTTPEELARAIRLVASGQSSLDPSIARKLVRAISAPQPLEPKNPLTPRETEVLKLFAQGLSNREVSDKLVISEWTTRTHMRNILGKLDLNSRSQAILYALREGLVSLEAS